MIPLNLPQFENKFQQSGDKTLIFDIIRKKYVALTPEEWVRQHLIHYLINELNYPKSLFSVERGLNYNLLAKRSDIVVYSRAGVPFLLVECKAPSEKISQKTINQAAVYNMTLNCEYMAVTNGMVHFCFQKNPDTGKFMQIADFPIIDEG